MSRSSSQNAGAAAASSSSTADDDLLFLDAPVEVTHDHYKKVDPIVQLLKAEHGYGNRIDERTCLYRKKRLTTSNLSSGDFLKDEMLRIEYEKRVRECVEKTFSKDVDIELDELLNRGDFDINEELLSKKLDFINSIEEYNRIIQFQLVKDLITVKSIQSKLSIDFALKMQEIKDYVNTIEDQQRMQKKLEELRIKAPKSLTDVRKKEIDEEIEKLVKHQESYLTKITSNIDLILNSENVTSTPIKRILLFQMDAMLYFLNELQSKPINYTLFLRQCLSSSTISFTNVNIFNEANLSQADLIQNQLSQEHMEQQEERFLFEHEAKHEEEEFLEGKRLRFPQGSVFEKNPAVLQVFERGGKNESGNSVEERVSKIQMRSQKYFMRKEKNETINQAPVFTKETIRLELQNLDRFHAKLSAVERVLSRSKLQRYDNVQKYLKIVWQYMDILAIQISCARNKLEKYLISLNGKVFVPHIMERVINRTVRLLSGMPDQETAKSYLENQKRNNTFKRYTNDLGKITNYHFVLNANNLKPLLQKIDPNTFLDDTKRIPKSSLVSQKMRKKAAAPNSRSQSVSKQRKPISAAAAGSSIYHQSSIISDASPDRQISPTKKTDGQLSSKQTGSNELGTNGGDDWGINPAIRDRSMSAVSHSSQAGMGMLPSSEDYLRGNNTRSVSSDYDPQSSIALHTSKPRGSVSFSNSCDLRPTQNLNIQKYINANFDESGMNNYFYEKQNEIDIGCQSKYVIMSNIFSDKAEELIGIDDFIEHENMKFTHSLATPSKFATPATIMKSYLSTDPKILFHERYSRFKQSAKLRRIAATTASTIQGREQISTPKNHPKNKRGVSLSHVLPDLDISVVSSSSDVNNKNSTITNNLKTTSGATRPLSVTFYFENEKIEGHHRKSSIHESQLSQSQASTSRNGGGGKQSRFSSLSTKNDITDQQLRTQSNLSSRLTTSEAKRVVPLTTAAVKTTNRSVKTAGDSTTTVVSQDENGIGAGDKSEWDSSNLKEEQKLENQKLKNRRDLMQHILERKRPRYICIGKSRVAVKGTAQEISKMERNVDIAHGKSQDEMKVRNREKLKKKIQDINQMWEASNIEVLSGPPKKHYVEISTIQHDFNDRLISKIIKR